MVLPFFYPLGVFGGYPPYQWSVASGSLPPGLAVDPVLGALRGTPTARGRYSFAARAVDSRGTAVNTQYSFTVLQQSTIGAPAVVEFYNLPLDNFFLTANEEEAMAIEAGSAGPGWNRTGEVFVGGGPAQVCRFYGSLAPGPNSHFYTIDPNECAMLKQIQQTTPATTKRWNFESLDFASTPAVGGNCAPGLEPVYRAYNNGFARGIDSNHRIARSLTAINEVVARGWLNDGVVMCAAAP